jgi:hypothetical protein
LLKGGRVKGAADTAEVPEAITKRSAMEVLPRTSIIDFPDILGL